MKVMDIVAHILKLEHVEFLTGFPHNQVIDSCSAVGIRPIITRTERVAINMADGFSRMSNNKAIGVCAVQYGPGVENGFGAIAQAYADASNILVIPGGYDSHETGVAPNFQAVENLRSVTKAVMRVNYPDRTALMLNRAFGLLRSGKPGPVVLEIPDDLMTAEAGTVPDDYAPIQFSRSQWCVDRTQDSCRALARPCHDDASRQELISGGPSIVTRHWWSFAHGDGRPLSHSR